MDGIAAAEMRVTAARAAEMSLKIFLFISFSPFRFWSYIREINSIARINMLSDYDGLTAQWILL